MDSEIEQNIFEAILHNSLRKKEWEALYRITAKHEKAIEYTLDVMEKYEKSIEYRQYLAEKMPKLAWIIENAMD